MPVPADTLSQVRTRRVAEAPSVRFIAQHAVDLGHGLQFSGEMAGWRYAVAMARKPCIAHLVGDSHALHRTRDQDQFPLGRHDQVVRRKIAPVIEPGEIINTPGRCQHDKPKVAFSLDPKTPDAPFMAHLDELIEKCLYSRAHGDPPSFTQLDMEAFHHPLGLTANLPLRAAMERLYCQTKRLWLEGAIATRLDIEEEDAMFHRELVDIRFALKAGDLSAAAHVRPAHISLSFSRLLNQHG